MKKRHSLYFALAIGVALVGGKIYGQVSDQDFAQYGGGGAPSSGGAAGMQANIPMSCPLAGTSQAAQSSCVTVYIPQNAAGMGPAAYGPNPLNVALGATVIWVNQDSVQHTVTANDGSFNSQTLNPGESFSHTFNAPGSNPYYCMIHGAQAMSGNVNVSNTPAQAIACNQPAAPVPVFVPVVVPRPTVTVTVRPSPSPSHSPSPSPSPSHSPSPSPSPSHSPSPSPSPSVSPSPSPSPSVSPSPSPSPSASPSRSPTQSPSASPQPGAAPASPSPSPSP